MLENSHRRTYLQYAFLTFIFFSSLAISDLIYREKYDTEYINARGMHYVKYSHYDTDENIKRLKKWSTNNGFKFTLNNNEINITKNNYFVNLTCRLMIFDGLILMSNYKSRESILYSFIDGDPCDTIDGLALQNVEIRSNF